MLQGTFSSSEKRYDLGQPVVGSRGASFSQVWQKAWNVKNLDQGSGHASDESTGCWIAFSGRAWWRNGEGAVQPAQLLKYLLNEGSQALRRMDGSFAVAWLDGRKGTLSLARDYFGIEPLHYSLLSDRAVFASRVPGILALLPEKPTISPKGLRDYLVYCYSPGTRTLIDGVERVPPGSVVTVRLQNATPVADSQRWFQLSYQYQPLTDDASIAREFQVALEKAVQRRVQGDRPAVMLSGGMDSSAAVSLMRHYEPGDIRTYSFRCGGKSFDESSFARQLADKLGTKHTQVEFTEQDALEFGEAVKGMDTPFSDCGIEIGTWLVVKAAGGDVDYIMTGDGGDEFWASHPVYAAQRFMRYYDRLPISKGTRQGVRDILDRVPDSDKKRDIRVVAKRLLPDPHIPVAMRHARWKVYQNDTSIAEMLNEMAPKFETSEEFYSSMLKFFDGFDGPANSLDAMLYNDYSTASAFYFSRLLLFRQKGVEPRMPFYDPDIAELGARIPFHKKLEAVERTKRLFRQAVRGIVPDFILDRKEKLGHSVPMKNWLRTKGPLHDQVSGVLLEELAGKRGLIQRSFIEKLFKEHETSRHNHSHRLWALYILELWLKEHVDKAST